VWHSIENDDPDMGSEGIATTRRRERSAEEVTPEMMIIGATLGILMLALVAWLI
jgi:hypothetical protein